jgi:hypothetical protein
VSAAHSHLQPVSVSEAAELRALLEAVRLGERDAVGRFFDRFERDVNALVWALLGPTPTMTTW